MNLARAVGFLAQLVGGTLVVVAVGLLVSSWAAGLLAFGVALFGFGFVMDRRNNH